MKNFFTYFLILLPLCVVSANIAAPSSDVKKENSTDTWNSNLKNHPPDIKRVKSDFTRNQRQKDEKSKPKIRSAAGGPTEPVKPTSTTVKPDSGSTSSPPTPKSVQFTETLYMIEVGKNKLKDANFTIPFGVSFKEDYNETIDLSLKDRLNLDISSEFEISRNKQNVVIRSQLSKTTSETILQKVGQFIFVLKAIVGTSNETATEAILIMNLKNEKNTSQPGKLIFTKSKYEIRTLVEYTGIVEQFMAKLENEEDKIIKYTICSNATGLQPDALSLDTYTGILRTQKNLDTGVFKFEICAETNDQKYRDVATVELVVQHVVVCDSNQINFVYSLLVVRVPEGMVVRNIVPPAKVQERCHYRISSQTPEGDYFHLDSKTGALSLKKEVYKDYLIFKNTDEPKFIVELSVACNKKSKKSIDETDANAANNPAQDEVDEEEQCPSIKYDPKRMLVFVVIEGENVQFPDHVFVGYPRQYDFILQNPPPLLTTIRPINRDRTKNLVQYTIEDSNCPFSIHPSTGNVYPVEYYSKEDELTFTVVAKISNKNKTSNETRVKVTVQFLSPSQIVEIFLSNVTLENVDISSLNTLNANVNFTMKEFTHAVVPYPLTEADSENSSSSNSSRNERTLLTKTLFYALDENESYNVVNGDVIVESLRNLSNIRSIRVMSKKSDSSEHTSPPSGIRSYLLISLVIFLLTAAIVLVVVVIYSLFVRKSSVLPTFCFKMMSRDRHTSTPLENEMEGPSETSWISSRVNIFSNYNQMADENRTNRADGLNRRVSFSRDSGEAVVLNCQNNCENFKNPLPPSLSTFKPNDQNNRHSTSCFFEEHVNMKDTGVDVERNYDTPGNGLTDGTSTVTDVPILPVISLPPRNDKPRNRRRTSSDTNDTLKSTSLNN